MPLPPKLLKKASPTWCASRNARMSGTAYGTVVLHVCPEAAAGGALALVENGDMIELDVEKRRLVLLVAEDVLLKRRKSWKLPPPPLERGYWKLYFDHVLQASEGADLDSSSARAVPSCRAIIIDGRIQASLLRAVGQRVQGRAHAQPVRREVGAAAGDFFGGETRTPEYRAVNEMGEVPVLEHRGKRLSQSGVILHYLAAHFGKFAGGTRRATRDPARMLWDNHKLTSYIATLRYMVHLAKVEPQVHDFLAGA